MNNAGDVVGMKIGNNWPRVPFLYRSGVLTNLETVIGSQAGGTALDINNAGQILSGDNFYGPIIYDGVTITNLGSLDGHRPSPLAMNDQGHVVGSITVEDGLHDHAFLYRDNQIIVLGALGGSFSRALAINNYDEVVGILITADQRSHGFLYRGGQMIDLQSLLPAEAGDAEIYVATGINDSGQIVGYGSTGPFILSPEGAFTAPGTNVTVHSGSNTLTFSDVTVPGNTIVSSIEASTIGDVPGGFAVSEAVAYQITTTATYSGPITIALSVPDPITEADFDSLIVLHNENGVLVDVTATSLPRNYATRTIYAVTNSLSPFYLVRTTQHIAPMFDTAKAYKRGRTIPIKLRLMSSANTNLSSPSRALTARNLLLTGGNTTSSMVDPGNANPDSNFRYDASLGGYIFNLSTNELSPGTYVLSLYAGPIRSFFYTIRFEVK
jgi:probable HAF family extracellular repeat protein